MQTKPPYAIAAVAYAAFLRSCSTCFAASQIKSPKQPFKSVKNHQTVPPFRCTLDQHEVRGKTSIHLLQTDGGFGALQEFCIGDTDQT